MSLLFRKVRKEEGGASFKMGALRPEGWTSIWERVLIRA